MARTILQFHTGTNGRQPRPNVYKRSLEARQTTDGFLLAAAGFDTDKPRVAWYRRMKVWELGVGVLLAVGLAVAMVVI